MHIFIDESGCMGFSPGSSTYFCIACLVIDEPYKLTRVIRYTKQKYNIPKEVELKASQTSPEIKKEVLTGLAALDIQILTRTVYKADVNASLRGDKNKLYNYMVGLNIIPYIISLPLNSTVHITLDNRTIAVESGKVLEGYLKIKVHLEHSRSDITMYVLYVSFCQMLFMGQSNASS